MRAADILIKRRRLGLRQNEAAIEAGISPGTLVDIEREKVVVSEADLCKVDAALDRLAARRAASKKHEREGVMA